MNLLNNKKLKDKFFAINFYILLLYLIINISHIIL